jgi:hypothetical protein
MNIAVTAPSPIDIDPRPCEWCGLTIDCHVMVDDGEGPEFFCQEGHPYAANLVVQWELADPRDRWRVTGEAPPPAAFRNSEVSARPERPRHYRTPHSTVEAFLRLTAQDDPDELAQWLKDHPRDAAYLLKIWKARQ